MKNPQAASSTPKQVMTTKTIACCALLAALSVVLARLIIPMPNATTRFSIEAVPIFLAGMLFGPMAGGLVGFTADFVGCLFSGYGYNPLFCVPPILYGICGGLFRGMIAGKASIPRLTLAFFVPVVLGSVLYQSFTLTFVYYTGDSFLVGLASFLASRSVQFAITLVLDVAVVYLLLRAKVLDRIGLWPPVKNR